MVVCCQISFLKTCITHNFDFLFLLGPFGVHFRLFFNPLGPFGVHLGLPWRPLDVHWTPFGVQLEAIWVPFGAHLESIWGPFGIHFGPAGGGSEVIFDHLSNVSGLFLEPEWIQNGPKMVPK